MSEDNYHQTKVAELDARERELRLRELELEIERTTTTVRPTVEYSPRHKSMRTFKGDLILAGKLSGLFIGGIVVVYVSQWLAWISFFALLATAGWAWFKFGNKR